MGTTTEAKKTDGKIENPPDCKTRGKCPCNIFERCRKRRPYGSDVWSDSKKKKLAMGLIAFDGNKNITDEKKLNDLWTRFVYRNEAIKAYNNTHEKKWRFNEFFANIRSTGALHTNALVLPEVSDSYITQQMNQLRQNLKNMGYFTDFQRSMVARANLVRNHGLMSDTYRTRGKGQDFNSKPVIPYAKGYRSEMWSVDHVQIRAKGGCNRFCNAAVLMLGDNSSRGDNGPGCPCRIAVKNGKEKPNTDSIQTEMETGYEHFECVTYYRKKKKGEAPEERPGTCADNKLCNLDDPREGKKRLKHGAVRPVYK